MREIEQMELTSADLERQIDFRPYMDPSPYVVSDLMPLRRVYRFFNEIGVRHLTVIDCREEVVGITALQQGGTRSARAIFGRS